MKKDKKATIAETIFVIGIPFISAATMVFKMNQMRTQVYRELLKIKKRKEKTVVIERRMLSHQGVF